MSQKAKNIAAMVFVNVMWGLSFVLSKHALTVGFPPMTLALVRYLFASVIFLLMSLKAREKLTLKKQDIIPLFLSGLFGITFYYYFEYTGIGLTSTVNASMILAAIPVMTMLAEALFMRSGITRGKIIGAFTSLGGVALIVLLGEDEGTGSLPGNLLIFCASLVWVLYIFLSRTLRARYSSLAMNTLQSLSALLTLLPLALAEKAQWVPVPLSGWLSAFVLAAVCSALCYWLYGNALSALSPLASAIFINLIPLTTILAGVSLLGESMMWLQGVGGVMIVASIFIVTFTGGPPKDSTAA